MSSGPCATKTRTDDGQLNMTAAPARCGAQPHPRTHRQTQGVRRRPQEHTERWAHPGLARAQTNRVGRRPPRRRRKFDCQAMSERPSTPWARAQQPTSPPAERTAARHASASASSTILRIVAMRHLQRQMIAGHSGRVIPASLMGHSGGGTRPRGRTMAHCVLLAVRRRGPHMGRAMGTECVAKLRHHGRLGHRSPCCRLATGIFAS